MNDLYLQHHGIKGMKWGVRRYQNYDGTLKNPKGRKNKFNDNYKEPSSKEVFEYRKEMLSRYNSDKEKKALYGNMSDKELREEIRRRQNIKKALVGVSVAAGVAIGVYAAYRIGSLQQISRCLAKGEAIDARKIALNAMDDIDSVLHKDSVLHRMVGFEGYSLDKVTGQMYTSFHKKDVSKYAIYLKDRKGAKGRWDVSLKAVKDIKIPSRNNAEKIFNDLWKNDPSFKNNLNDQLIDIYKKLGADDEYAKAMAKKKISNPFMAGVYSLVGQGPASDKFKNSLLKSGYIGLYDYYDKVGGAGGMDTKKPLILLDKTSISVVGEKKFTI